MKLSLGFVSWTGLVLTHASAFQSPISSSSSSSGVYSSSSRTTTCLSLVVDFTENAARDIVAMDEWATACGVSRAEGIQLAPEEGAGVGVVTTENLAVGSPVLYVPSAMILSSRQSYEEFGRVEAAEDLLGRLDSADHIRQFYLFLKILTEYEKGDQSPWYPWLNSLPRSYTNGASMTPFCYECLPPLIASLAASERVKFINFYSAAKVVPFLGDETKRNRDLARWAFQVVYTRSFEDNGDILIVPMADMFNHGTETEIEISYDEEGNCFAHTTRDVPGGSPLRMSYGHPTNPSYFFSRYGFLDETSPATFCKIMIPKPNQKQLDLGYDYSRMLFFKDTGEVSEEVWDVLLFQVLEFADIGLQKTFYEAHMRGDSQTKQSIHQQFFKETSGALKKHVNDFLNELEALDFKAVGKDVNEHPRLPLILKHNEFVRKTFLAVKARQNL